MASAAAPAGARGGGRHDQDAPRAEGGIRHPYTYTDATPRSAIASWTFHGLAALWTGTLLAFADYGLAILGSLAAVRGVPGFDGLFGPDPSRVTVRFFAILGYGIIATLMWRRRRPQRGRRRPSVERRQAAQATIPREGTMERDIEREYDDILQQVGEMDIEMQMLFAQSLTSRGALVMMRDVLLQLGETLIWAIVQEGQPPSQPIPERLRRLAQRFEDLTVAQARRSIAA